LSRPSSAASKSKKTGNESEDTDTKGDEDGSGRLQKLESLQPSDAFVCPLMAGLAILGSLYLVIIWLEDVTILSKVLSIYYSQIDIFLAAALVKDGLSVLRAFIFPRRYQHGNKIWQVKQAKRIFIQSKDANTSVTSDIQMRHLPLPACLGQLPLPKWALESLWFWRGLCVLDI
jgi:hypothetical protein